MSTKTIGVIGATGMQGGGLVRAILADHEKQFAARAITRKPDSDKGRNEELRGQQSREVARALNPTLQSFDCWLTTNASRIPFG